MKKLLLFMSMLILLVGCTAVNENVDKNTEAKEAVQAVEKSENNEASEEKVEIADTIIYASEHGDIEVPADPKRIVILDSSAAGSLMLFDGSIVGHEPWTAGNALFADYLKDSTEVSVDNLEQILALNPDLIVTSPYNENFDELSQIAPTVSFTYGRLNYLDTIVEYGKLVNKEEEAKAWVADYKEKAKAAGERIKAKYGDDVSISVIEAYGDEMYLYGDNWGRGTQIVYQEMGLVMPETVQEVALTDGYYSISSEVIGDYSADLMIFAYFSGSNMAFKETETWQNIDAVKNSLVLEVEAETFYMTGPITLSYQLETIEGFFLD